MVVYDGENQTPSRLEECGWLHTALALSHQPWRSDVCFYFFRWWAGKSRIEHRYITTPDNFFYSASLGLLIWGLSASSPDKSFAESTLNAMTWALLQLFETISMWLGTPNFWLILPALFCARRVMLYGSLLCSSLFGITGIFGRTPYNLRRYLPFLLLSPISFHQLFIR